MGRAAKSGGGAATYADLEAVPPHLVAEIIFGTLETHPRPSPKHATAQGAVAAELGGPFQRGRGGPGGWIFMIEPELHLGPHVVVPDIAGWRRERLPHLPATAFVETPPDWVCELLSPSTENLDRGPKRRIYATYGVGHMWFVDATGCRLESYGLHDGCYAVYETFDGDDDVKAPPFDAVLFPVSALWPLDQEPAAAL